MLQCEWKAEKNEQQQHQLNFPFIFIIWWK